MCDFGWNCTFCVTKNCFFGHLQNDSTVCVSQRSEVRGWYHFIVDPGDVAVCPFQPTEPDTTTDAWVKLTRAGKSASSAASSDYQISVSSMSSHYASILIVSLFIFFVFQPPSSAAFICPSCSSSSCGNRIHI
jgi:hypothetical protein